MGGKKFMLVRFAEDGDVPGAQLSMQGGGGAAIANCNGASIIAFVEKDKKNSLGKDQTHAEALAQVVAIASYLKEQGY